MNTLILKIVVVLSALHFYLPSYAQQLTAEEKELLQTRVKNKVDEYQYYLKQLSDKLSTSRAVKDNAYTLALKLFIGEGENYEVSDEDLCRDVIKSAVRMEISSKYRSTKSRIMQKRYLINLRENRTYSQIEITDADVVRIDNIHRVGNHYECMAYFCQNNVPPVKRTQLTIDQLRARTAYSYSKANYDLAYDYYEQLVSRAPTDGNAAYRIALMTFWRKGCKYKFRNRKSAQTKAKEYLNKAIAYGSPEIKSKAENVLNNWNQRNVYF